VAGHEPGSITLDALIAVLTAIGGGQAVIRALVLRLVGIVGIVATRAVVSPDTAARLSTHGPPAVDWAHVDASAAGRGWWRRIDFLPW
jgi:hypothetical protein